MQPGRYPENVSPEKLDPPAPPEDPHVFSLTTVLGIVCFAAGLLLLAGGILLAIRWLLGGDAGAAVAGGILIVLGIGVNITGLVLLYRGVTNPRRGARNNDRNP